MVAVAVAGATLAACASDEGTTTAVSSASESASSAATTASATNDPASIDPASIDPATTGIGSTNPTVVDGYIVGIAPNLRLADGTIPGVDVIHLHHGVWLNASARDATAPGLPERFFAAGEEKTTMVLPAGYGYAYHPTDNWVVNYMIHNLYPIEQQVWITYDVDFIPGTDPVAATMQRARPIWTDVQNGSVYPVFDVIKGSGSNGLYTYPTDAATAYGGGPTLNAWTVDRDGVLIATVGHLHPGGMHTDLLLQHPPLRRAAPSRSTTSTPR